MRKIDVLHFYGSRGAVKEISTLLGVSHSAVCQWGEIIPKGAALELEKLTGGALKCDLSLYKSRQRKNKHGSAREA
ncbi:hypothetical protein XS46_004781 [Salmonella enterica subsp. enterica]|nr:hypothetical protein [Salmonella enterica subsp. enterica]